MSERTADVLSDTENVFQGMSPDMLDRFWAGMQHWIHERTGARIRQVRSYGKPDARVRMVDDDARRRAAFEFEEVPVGSRSPFRGASRPDAVRFLAMRVGWGANKADRRLIRDLESAVADGTLAHIVVVGSADHTVLDHAEVVAADLDGVRPVWIVLKNDAGQLMRRRWSAVHPGIPSSQVVLAADLTHLGSRVHRAAEHLPKTAHESPTRLRPALAGSPDRLGERTIRRLDAIIDVNASKLATSRFGSPEWRDAVGKDSWLVDAIEARIPGLVDDTVLGVLRDGKGNRPLCWQLASTAGLSALLDECTVEEAGRVLRRLWRDGSRYGSLRTAAATWLHRS